MNFAVLIQHMIEAACRGDGSGVARCFALEGVYHDVFYGSFRGRAESVRMIEENFRRGAVSSAGIFMIQCRSLAPSTPAMSSAIARG